MAQQIHILNQVASARRTKILIEAFLFFRDVEAGVERKSSHALQEANPLLRILGCLHFKISPLVATFMEGVSVFHARNRTTEIMVDPRSKSNFSYKSSCFRNLTLTGRERKSQEYVQ